MRITVKPLFGAAAEAALLLAACETVPATDTALDDTGAAEAAPVAHPAEAVAAGPTVRRWG